MDTDVHGSLYGVRENLCRFLAKRFRFFFLVPFFVVCSVCFAVDDRVSLPDGFKLTQVASDDLATNIYCLIALPDGETLVSGPGYIKKLIDDNDDGIFDQSERVSDFPQSGAQGMAVDGDDLLCVGDGGIWRLPGVMTQRGEGDASKRKPVQLFKISTNGEHHAHSIQKGPDGWWYLIAGNDTKFDSSSFAGPIRKPRAGVIMRFSPDFSRRQVMAHGFRNAYDFAFNSTDQLFTFDSDGERDLGLPWYRPTRVFEIVPGDDAGWVSKTWKRPSYYFDMPRLIGTAGRASPTGVVGYDGVQFPEAYNDAIFLGDWTFGRVLVCKREWKSGKYFPPVDFIRAKGSFGFAVTDLSVASDGSLLVSVGGRGTEGGVWRVCSTDKRKEAKESLEKYVWERRLAFREDVPVQVQIKRALKSFESKQLAMRSDALAALLVLVDSVDVEVFGNDLERILTEASQSDDPKVLGAAFRLVRALCAKDSWKKKLYPSLKTDSAKSGLVTLVRVATAQLNAERTKLVDMLGLAALGYGKVSNSGFSEQVACRLAQIVMGGVGQSNGVLSSITANAPLDKAWRDLDSIQEGNELVWNVHIPRSARLELWRLAAMCDLSIEDFEQTVLNRVTSGNQRLNLDGTSSISGRKKCLQPRFVQPLDPSDNLFWLMCFVKPDPTDDEGKVATFAERLLRVEKAFHGQDVKTDSHFRPMLEELASRAFRKYPAISELFLEHSNVGAKWNGFLFSEFTDEDLPRLQERVISWVQNHPRRATNDHVQVLSRNPTSKSLVVVRRLAKNRSLKDAVTLALAEHGDAVDRNVFVAGLQSFDPKVQNESAIALRKFNVRLSDAEAAIVLRAAMTLGNEKLDASVRDQMILLLRQHAGHKFGYELKRPDKNQSELLLKWKTFLIGRDPTIADTFEASETIQQQLARFEKLDWSGGDSGRGKQVYEQLQCFRCHGANSSLGPRLEGVTKRLGQNDLLNAIVNPNAQVSDRYRATVIESTDGQLFSGTVIYENIDGVTLRESTGQTVRLSRDQIEFHKKSHQSIMPIGLLDQLTDQQIVDLMEYLKSL